MLALIPLIDLFAIYMVFHLGRRDRDWQESILAAAVTWGTLVALSTELLGLVHVLQRQSVGAFWLVVLGICIVLVIRRRNRVSFRFARPQMDGPLAWAMLGIVALYMAVTLLVAIVAPPNTNDSMQYHMSRVMHWIVDRSVDFYPTFSDRQLWMPPFAEYAILHFQLLAGNDILANLVQWLSMAGSVLGASLIASRLGAGQKGQLFAALFAVTLPMGVLQSTSTQTDYVAAFWGICLVYFAMAEANRVASGSTDGFTANSFLMTLAFGLGVLAKGTFVVCAVPFLAWLLAVLLWKRKWKLAAGLAFLGLTALLLLNGNLWWKNFRTFGSPLGPAAEHLGSTVFTPAAIFSTGLRNAAMQMAFDTGPANKALYFVVQGVHEILGMDLNDPRTTLGTYRIRHSVHEDFAGNNWHFIFSALSVVSAFGIFAVDFYRRRTRGKNAPLVIPSSNYDFYKPLYFGLAVFLAYMLFSALFKWQDTDSRLLLPWFLTAAPLTGWVFGRVHRYIQFAVVFLLALSSLTVLLSNPSRPLIVTGQNESILKASRMKTRFNNSPEIMDGYLTVASTARDLKCDSLGLALDSHTSEYLIWAALSPSGQEYSQVENLLAFPGTGRFATPGFRPCAIICDVCGVAQDMGYEKIVDRGSLQLYINPEEK